MTAFPATIPRRSPPHNRHGTRAHCHDSASDAGAPAARLAARVGLGSIGGAAAIEFLTDNPATNNHCNPATLAGCVVPPTEAPGHFYPY